VIKLDVMKIFAGSTTNADARDLFAVANHLVKITAKTCGLLFCGHGVN